MSILQIIAATMALVVLGAAASTFAGGSEGKRRCGWRVRRGPIYNRSVEAAPAQPITGNVTIDGKPLAGGTVTFQSAREGEPVLSGTIIDGQFKLDQPPLKPGQYRVLIQAPPAKK